MNNTYNQQQIDERFEALIAHCHHLGFHKLAAHYEKAVGMQRVHAIRLLEAVFITREQNTRKIIRSYALAILALLVFTLIIVLSIGGIP